MSMRILLPSKPVAVPRHDLGTQFRGSVEFWKLWRAATLNNTHLPENSKGEVQLGFISLVPGLPISVEIPAWEQLLGLLARMAR